ncbi:MAG: bifunctional methylenetetrahydrofolate dehydrogenase/methenyltetrahydrofolate cyclohydrolase FolD [Gammaproteobacteria bacterium]
MSQIIDGKQRAQALRENVASGTAKLKAEHGVTPGLAVVLAGEDPASQVYVRNKGVQAKDVGFESFTHKLPDTVTQDALLALVDQLNADPAVHGILVQLPLPPHVDEQAVIDRIDPDKDVDGFHVINAGRLAVGQEGFVPCTPLGCSMMIRDCGLDLSGLNAVIVGRSNIVGKPMAALLLRENCTVTIAHSRTKDLPALCRTADVLVAAVGRPHMIGGDWIKPGAIVIDVGINRIARDDGGTRLVGDVDYAAASEYAAFITPVPGGVGPMTIACLLSNTLLSATRHAARS